jgi:hypothetical protein
VYVGAPAAELILAMMPVETTEFTVIASPKACRAQSFFRSFSAPLISDSSARTNEPVSLRVSCLAGPETLIVW